MIIGSVIVAAVFPLLVLAQGAPPPLGAGCHYTTDTEKQQLIDRGIPVAYETCPKDTQILGIGDNFDQWYAQLKTQSPCNKNTCGLACTTRNTGAQVCGPTATRWNSIGCHPNNNTAIFPTVAYGFAAHIELLRRYCGERGRCTIITVIQQWAGDVSAHASYANFVSKNSGIPVNQVFNPNDVDLMGRIALAMSCFESGSMPYNVSDLKQGLAMAGGGAKQPIPANVGQLLQQSLTSSYAPPPAGVPHYSPSSWAYPAQSVVGSTYFPPTPPPAPLPIIPNSIDTSGTSVTPGNGTPGGTTNQPPSNPGQNNHGQTGLHSENLLTQPSSVHRGDPIIVSWTSVGLSGQCHVLIGTSQALGQGTEGTQHVSNYPTSGASVDFTLQCPVPGGSIDVQTATVNFI